MRTILIICALATLGAHGLQAQDKPTPPPQGGTTKTMTAEETFKSFDANGDGFLTREELLAKPLNPNMPKAVWARMVDNFMKKDTNGDGKLSLEEWKTPIARRKKPGGDVKP